MKGHLTMSVTERQRKSTLERVKRGEITLKRGSELMGVSYRQGKRIGRRFKRQGDAGLVHGNRGKPSNRAKAQAFKEGVLAYYKAHLMGFGPTFASEKLDEAGYSVDHETLRRWLLAAHLWVKQRKRSPYRQRRARRERFGDLLQIDGSIHGWLCEQKPTCLLNAVDDATGTSYAIMREGETTEGVLSLLKGWMERYGIPKAVYVDLKSVYIGLKGNSVFEQVCKRLGIEVIKAYSPQAKGGVERNHGVYQDRLVKEIQLQGLKTIDEVNALLEGGFVQGLNQRFAKAPAKAEQGHVKLKKSESLDSWLYWSSERVVQNDWTVSYEGRCYQLLKTPGVRPKSRIEVRVYLDGQLRLWHGGKTLAFTPISNRAIKPLTGKPIREKPCYKPANDHPWRTGWSNRARA